MPAQRQTNMHSLTALLCEARDTDGTLYPAAAVDPGESIDWPHPIAGFSGWVTPAPEGLEAAESDAAEPAADAPASAKSRTKASAKAADTTEATA